MYKYVVFNDKSFKIYRANETSYLGSDDYKDIL